MGPLEISGTSSAGAQGKTPSCAADSRGAGREQGRRCQRRRSSQPSPLTSPQMLARHDPAPTHQQPTGLGGVRSLGKYLLGGKLPARRAVLSHRAMGTLQRCLVHGAVLSERHSAACGRPVHSFSISPGWQIILSTSRGLQVSSARCQHAEGQGHMFPSSSPCCTSRLLLSAPASPTLATSHSALGRESSPCTYSVPLSTVSVPPLSMPGGF